MYGIFAPFVFVLGGAAFETPGRNSWQEGIAGGTFVAIYLALVQFLLLRRGPRTLREAGPMMAGAAVPVVLGFCVIAAFETPSTLLMQGVPMLLGAMAGILIGALLGVRPQAISDSNPSS